MDFKITIHDFRPLAIQTQYATLRGLSGSSLTIDRIDNLKGYLPDNIRAITRSENSVKRAKFDAVRMRAGFAWKAA